MSEGRVERRVDETGDKPKGYERIAVSISRDGGPVEEKRARRLAAENGWEYMAPPAHGGLTAAAGGSPVLVVEKRRLSLRLGDSSYGFHPGLALVRIKRIQAGETDNMLAAMGLLAGPERPSGGAEITEVLDCTLGFGADAIVAAFAVGESGRVVGLESERVLAVLARHGLQDWAEDIAKEDLDVAAAFRRIEVICADHLDFLRRQAPRSFDVVYFDPMFREPARGAAGLAPIRVFGRPDPLRAEVLAEALRVARRRVVLKERRKSPEFARLGCPKIIGGNTSRVAYGVWEVGP